MEAFRPLTTKSPPTQSMVLVFLDFTEGLFGVFNSSTLARKLEGLSLKPRVGIVVFVTK